MPGDRSPGVRPGCRRARPPRRDRSRRRRNSSPSPSADAERTDAPDGRRPRRRAHPWISTLEEATTRALERNLELAVERLNPQTFDLNIARLQAAFRPTLTSQFGQRALVQPPTNQLNGGTIVQNDTTTYNAGIAQLLPWGGGDVAFQFNNNKQVTSNIFANFNPTFTSNFNLTFTQPLLRGFRSTTPGSSCASPPSTATSPRSSCAARSPRRWPPCATRTGSCSTRIEAVEVARGSLDLAEKLVEDNRARVEIGTMAPLDVVQAEAEVATRRQAVAQAEATWRTSELALKRLIVNGTDDPLWRASINPTDRPTFAPEPLDVEGAVRKALDNRTDLEQARRQIDSNDIDACASCGTRCCPRVDLTANYGAQGLGGTQFIRQGTGLGSTVIGTIPGGYSRRAAHAGRPRLSRPGTFR